MNLQNNPRQFFFNWIDKVTGGKKSNQYKDVKFLIEAGNTQEAILKKQNYLVKLLIHAASTTIFYKPYEKAKSITDFPVVNKNIIKTNFSQFESALYKSQKKLEVKTSGSTGSPFSTFQNKEKILRNTADNLYFANKAGYSIGNKLYYFRMWRAFEQKGLLSRLAQNVIPIDVFNLNDGFFKNFLMEISKNKSPMSWIGYASAFDKLCKYLDTNNYTPITCNLQSVIAISEILPQQTKISLKKYFGVDTVSRYSNIENGIIAQQFPNTPYFVINTASYHIEILHLNSNNPVKNGEKGRIVVTDLFNYCVPMIRYDTGDIGCMEIINGNPVLSQIEGRKTDTIFNTKGEIITNGIAYIINNYHELKQCQLIQKDVKNYLFKINIEGHFANEKTFKSDFKSYLGNDAIIDIEYVDEIPLLASGKRRVLVNEMKF